MLANAVHWFNPLVYIAVNQAACNLEVACDEEVVKNRSLDFRKEYANTILKVMRHSINRQTVLSTHFLADKRATKQRFMNILDMGKKRQGIGLLFVLIIIICTSGMLIACSSVDNQPAIQASVSLENLTPEEYQKVGTHGIDNPSVNDFRKLIVSVDVQNLDNRIINFPSIIDMKDLLTTDIVWFTHSFSRDNPQEDFAQYRHELVLYTRGYTTQEIKDKFKSLNIEISYINKQEKTITDTYNLADSMVVN